MKKQIPYKMEEKIGHIAAQIHHVFIGKTHAFD